MRARVRRAAATTLAAVLALVLGPHGLDAQRRQRAPQRPEFEVRELGLRVVEVPHPVARPLYGGSPEPVSQVVAVREGGPAHYAGLVPGDIIHQSEGYRAHPQAIMGEAASGGSGWGGRWRVYYQVEGESAPRDQLIVITYAPAGQGRWITDVPVHRGGRAMLPGFDELRASAAQHYDRLWAEAQAYVSADPCAARVSEMERRGEELNLWARLSARRESMHEYRLVNIARTACQNARTGGLPAFEGALWAMTDWRISPCAYDPARDYSAELRDPRYAQWGTRRDYEASILIRIRGFRSRDPQAGACLMDLLRARLTGRPWQPTAQPDSAPAPPPQQAAPPTRRGERRT